MNFKKTLLASLLMISASGAFAAESATLSVKGTIAPTACNVTLGGASQGELTFDVTDYAGDLMTLEPQTIPFNIACSPNAIAVTYTVSDDSSNPDTSRITYGLGKHTNGDEIGRFAMKMSDATADNVSARPIFNTQGSWNLDGAVVKSSAGRNSFASATGDVAPVMAKDFSATLTVSPTISPGLPANEAIELAGAVTFTITMI